MDSIFALVSIVARILYFAIIVRVILEMVVRATRPNSLVVGLLEALQKITDPILMPVRKIVYRGGPFDLSPMVAVIFLLMISEIFARAG